MDMVLRLLLLHLNLLLLLSLLVVICLSLNSGKGVAQFGHFRVIFWATRFFEFMVFLLCDQPWSMFASTYD